MLVLCLDTHTTPTWIEQPKEKTCFKQDPNFCIKFSSAPPITKLLSPPHPRNPFNPFI